MRKKNGFKKGFIVLLILALLLGAFSFYLYKQLESKSLQYDGLYEEMQANRQTVYVATEYIEKNTEIIADGDNANVTKQTIYTGLEGENYITEEQVGGLAIVDIAAWMPIMTNMVADQVIYADTREYEMTVVNLMTDQRENDFIDIRIMYPNGEDYVVLPKKQVKNLNLDNCVFFSDLNEEEILRMASATIDAYTISGTKIYCTRYVEENIQESAIPNYLVKAETIDLINSDPNILSIAQETLNIVARTNLEKRLAILSDDQLSAVTEGNGIADTAKNSVLLNTAANDGITENELEGQEINANEADTITTDTTLESGVQ